MPSRALEYRTRVDMNSISCMETKGTNHYDSLGLRNISFGNGLFKICISPDSARLRSPRTLQELGSVKCLEHLQTICCSKLLVLVEGTQFVASRCHASMLQFNISSHAITCLFIEVRVQVVLNVLDKLDQCHDVFMPDTTKKTEGMSRASKDLSTTS